MAALVVAEHDNAALKPATLNAVAAAKEIAGQDIDILVAGKGCHAVAEAAAEVAGIRKVLLADDAAYDHGLAENVAPLVVKLAENYSHLLAPATTSGKNLMPRVAARQLLRQHLDVVRDDRERRIHLMRDTRREQTERCEFLGLDQLLLKTDALRNIVHQDQAADPVA